jgi:hypothetical protein
MALICLAAVALSIAASVMTALQFLPG